MEHRSDLLVHGYSCEGVGSDRQGRDQDSPIGGIDFPESGPTFAGDVASIEVVYGEEAGLFGEVLLGGGQGEG